jgi:hypothetical protein
MRSFYKAMALAAGLLVAQATVAQDRKPLAPDEASKYVVSAKAGIMGIIEGSASVTHEVPSATPDMLLFGDELRTGDTVTTGAASRAEILLDPGCYLRVGEGTQFVYLIDGSANNKIKLLRGAAIIEAAVVEGEIVVDTPKSSFAIREPGIYRFNILSGRTSEVIVRKGKVYADKIEIKAGKKAIIDGAPIIAASSKSDFDGLDDWSKYRASELIATNKNLSNSVMKRSIFASGFVTNSWIYDPYCGCYTFLPGTAGFSSPYGWSYSVCNPFWYFSPWSGGGYYSGGRSSPGGGKTQPGGGSNAGGGGHGHPNRGGIHPPPPPRITPAGRSFEPSHGASAPAPSHDGGGKKH